MNIVLDWFSNRNLVSEAMLIVLRESNYTDGFDQLTMFQWFFTNASSVLRQ
jgi:hypothetical protein